MMKAVSSWNVGRCIYRTTRCSITEYSHFHSSWHQNVACHEALLGGGLMLMKCYKTKGSDWTWSKFWGVKVTNHHSFYQVVKSAKWVSAGNEAQVMPPTVPSAASRPQLWPSHVTVLPSHLWPGLPTFSFSDQTFLSFMTPLPPLRGTGLLNSYFTITILRTTYDLYNLCHF
jgi:hypothetical protein